MIYNSTKTIHSLVNTYSSTHEPVAVDFRQLVKPDFTNANRSTHHIHPYTAKLLPQIPYFFLSTEMLSRPGGIVLDPFCGSGTVLLESLLAGRNAIGADINPLARIISKVKTTFLDESHLNQSIIRLQSRIPDVADIPDALSGDYQYWFYPHVMKQLARLFSAIRATRTSSHRDFFLVCFSALLKKVSLADPRLSVPVRQKAEHYPINHPLREQAADRLRRLKRINVFTEFWEIVNENKNHILKLSETIEDDVRIIDIANDARGLASEGNHQKKHSAVDLIITSPPYSGAQKYTRASKLSLVWMSELEKISIPSIDLQCIGRENYKKSDYEAVLSTGIKEADAFLTRTRKQNPLRAHIASAYLVEMKDALSNACSLLKKGGYFVLVAGNNYVCGYEFPTVEYLTMTIESLGFRTILKVVDEIKSRGLMTKRNKTANLITREWVCIFEKI